MLAVTWIYPASSSPRKPLSPFPLPPGNRAALGSLFHSLESRDYTHFLVSPKMIYFHSPCCLWVTSRKQRGKADARCSADPAIGLPARSVGRLQPRHRAHAAGCQWDEMCEQFHGFPFVQSRQAFPCEASRTDGSFLLFPFLFVPLG